MREAEAAREDAARLELIVMEQREASQPPVDAFLVEVDGDSDKDGDEDEDDDNDDHDNDDDNVAQIDHDGSEGGQPTSC